MHSLDLSDPRLGYALAKSGKWARILAIIGFVFLGLAGVVMLFTFGTFATIMALQPGLETFSALGTTGLALVFGLYFGFAFFLTFKLYKFGSILHAGGRRTPSSARVEESFRHLAMLNKVAVLTLVVGIAVGLLGVVLMSLFATSL